MKSNMCTSNNNTIEYLEIMIFILLVVQIVLSIFIIILRIYFFRKRMFPINSYNNKKFKKIIV